MSHKKITRRTTGARGYKFELFWSIFNYIEQFSRSLLPILLFLGLFRYILEYLGLSRAMSGYLWLSQAISGYLGLSLAILDYLLLFETFIFLYFTDTSYGGARAPKNYQTMITLL